MWNGHAHVEQQHDNFDATDNEIHCARRDNGMRKSKKQPSERAGRIPQLLRKTTGSCTGGNELIQLVKPYAVGRQHRAWVFASELGRGGGDFSKCTRCVLPEGVNSNSMRTIAKMLSAGL